MLRKFELLVALLAFSITADAAEILVNPPAPLPQKVMGDSNIKIYFPGRNGSAPTAPAVLHPDYRYINASANDLIYIDVSTNHKFTVTTGQRIAVALKAGSGYVTLTGASQVVGDSAPSDCSSNSGGCLSTNTGAYYSENSTLRLSFTLSQLCSPVTTSSASALCSSSNAQDATNLTLTQEVDVYFGVVNPSATTGSDVGNSTGAIHEITTLGLTDEAPSITATCPSNHYFPGDSSIFLNVGQFTPNITIGTGAALQYLLVLAKDGAAVDAPPGGLTSNSIVSRVSSSGTSEVIKGFVNTTNGTDHAYNLDVYLQNIAGIISGTKSSCVVQSQSINGMLSESKCFIATAAYHDGRAAPVMMLRRFRDQVLSKFDLGRDFIKNYYHYSPALAEWAWDKPIIRSLALKVLTPIELMAWAILKVSSADEPIQPYVDRIKKQIGDEKVSTSESYSEIEKKKLETENPTPANANESYIGRIKKTLPPDESEEAAKDYSKKEKTKLPSETDRESPIKVVKDGRDDKLGFGDKPSIKNAASLKLGLSTGMNVSVANATHSFEEIYGSGYQPEMILHYERQLFHSENFGSFGIGGDFGIAYSGGKGLFQFGYSGSNVSQTGFGFFQVPVVLTGTYRFNLLRILRPYASAGGGAIFYNETREDSVSDKKGYSFVYQTSLGASLLLDFLDTKTSRDSYLADGIQHTYFFLEYLYLNSLKSSVMFKRAGLYAGFTFEF